MDNNLGMVSQRLTHSHSLSLILTQPHSPSVTLSHPHSPSLTVTHSHSLSLTHSHALSSTLIYSQNLDIAGKASELDLGGIKGSSREVSASRSRIWGRERPGQFFEKLGVQVRVSCVLGADLRNVTFFNRGAFFITA